jgi:catalase (peroxidase I)
MMGAAKSKSSRKKLVGESISASPTNTNMTDAVDLSRVRADIAGLLPSRSHDDGSYAPLLIRFSWHCCGTYDGTTGTGGSNGGTMRFEAEQNDPENAGLEKARQLLEPLKTKYPWISYADLYVLAGTVAIEATGGPHIRYRSTKHIYHTWPLNYSPCSLLLMCVCD